MARTKKKLDITTAKQADGALPSFRSVYELAGIRNVSYREKTYDQYQQVIRRMNLSELHDHAYEVQVVPAATKDIMIDRLERKYLQENPGEREKFYERQKATHKDESEMTVREKAEQIMARAR